MRSSIKAIASSALALLLALSLAACGTNKESTSAGTAATLPAIDITVAEKTTGAQTTEEAVTTAPETSAPQTTTEAVTTVPETSAETTEETGGQAAAPGPFEESDLILIIDGTALSLRMDFAPVAGSILGGVYDEQVGQACVGGGNDRAYYYEGDTYCIYTVGSASGAQTIYDIYIDRADGYTTAKGAVIGKTTRDEVLAIYGEPSFTTPAAERYSLGDLALIFGFDDDILSSVGVHDNAVQ